MEKFKMGVHISQNTPLVQEIRNFLKVLKVWQLLMVWNRIPIKFNTFYHFGGHLGDLVFLIILNALTNLIAHCFYNSI